MLCVCSKPHRICPCSPLGSDKQMGEADGCQEEKGWVERERRLWEVDRRWKAGERGQGRVCTAGKERRVQRRRQREGLGARHRVTAAAGRGEGTFIPHNP